MKLNYKRTFFVGLAFLSISAFWQVYDGIIPLILQNTFGLKETAVGVVMAADNVLAVFLLPILGAASDRVNTPLGKRTPFILVGTILTVIFMMMLPVAQASGNFVLFVSFLGLTLLSLALYRSPAVALMPDLTPKPLRSKGNAIINLMGALGAMISLVMISTLVPDGDNPSYQMLFIGIAVLMVIAIAVLLISIKEKKLSSEISQQYPEEAQTTDAKGHLPKDVRRSLIFILCSISLWFMAYNAVTTAFSRYASEIWGLEGGDFADALLVATVSAILSYIPIGIIASRIGRKRTILCGLSLMLIGFIGATFLTFYHPIINVGFALIGVGWASVSVNSLPMVVEMSRGSDIGRYTGFYYTFSMSAQIITPILSGFLLQNLSYRILFPYSIIFTVAAMCTMLLVKHGDSKPTRAKNVLENYDVED